MPGEDFFKMLMERLLINWLIMAIDAEASQKDFYI